MLRRNKKKDQPTSSTSGSFSYASGDTIYSTPRTPDETGPAPYQPIPSRPAHARDSADLLRGGGASSPHQFYGREQYTHAPPNAQRIPPNSSAEAMPPPSTFTVSHQPQGSFSSASSAVQPHTQLHQQQQQLQQQQQVGRSHSALNFFLSKAKNTFAGSSQATPPGHAPSASNNGLIYSNSLGSLASLHEDGSQVAICRPSMSHAPSSAGSYPAPYGSHAAQSSSSDLRQRSISRPSFDTDLSSLSSPTKKGFFSRERKTSYASKNATSAHSGQSRGAHSPLAGAAQSVPSYGHFSKSQGDLHARRDFPSPSLSAADLPRVPSIPQQIPGTIDDRAYLRSPSPHGSFARSADDLNAPPVGSPGGLGIRSPSPQAGLYAVSPQASGAVGTWGEHGVPAQSWGRPSDLGSVRPPEAAVKGSLQPAAGQMPSRTMSPSGSRADAIPFSSAPSFSPSPSLGGAPWPPSRGLSPSPEPAGAGNGHQRKSSKLPLGSDGFFSPSSTGRDRKGTASSLASSFSLGNVAAGASNVMDKLRGPGIAPERSFSSDSHSTVAPPLPPGVQHQGFLSRNANISLSLSHLTAAPGQREKDISKGWKPYKVLLRDGSLLFYKPPSSLNEDVKNLFPTAIVPGNAPLSSAGGRDYTGQALNADFLKQSGLGTQELLQATEPSGSDAIPRSAAGSPSKKAPPPTIPMEDEEVVQGPFWHLPGRHPDLQLVSDLNRPSRWAERIQSGTLEALANELVFASQLLPEDDASDVVAFAQVVLYLTVHSGKTISEFVENLQEAVLDASAVKVGSQCNGKQVGQGNELKSFQDGMRSRTMATIEILRSHHAEMITQAVAATISDLSKMVAGPEAAVTLQQHEPQADKRQPTDWAHYAAAVVRPKLASLAQGHLSASDLLSFDPMEVAQQIQIFHADRLTALAAPRLWTSALARGQDASAEDGSQVPGSSPYLFSFNGDQPHFLTKLALDHILDPNALPPQTKTAAAAAKHRASLLRHWIAIASFLLSFGDLLGWTAIMVALCSRAVARLEQTWRYVADGDRNLVANSWAPKLAKMHWNEESVDAIQPALTMASVTSRQLKARDGKVPQCLPFLGDSLVRAVKQYEAADKGAGHLPVSCLSNDVASVYSTAEAWFRESCQGVSLPPEAIISIGKPIKEFQQLLQLSAASRGACNISSYVTISLELEPRGLGNVDLRWRPAFTPAIAAKAIIPLVFAEPLPTLDLLDRQEAMAAVISPEGQHHGAGESDPDATVRPSKYVRSPLSGTPLMRASIQSLARSKTFPTPSQRGLKGPYGQITEWGAKSTGDDETLFRIGSDLILRASDDTPSSIPSSPMTGKRFSQELSRGSRPLSQISKRSSLPASNRSSFVETLVPTQVTIKAATLERLVDVLVLGVSDLTVSLSDDNGEQPLQGGRRSRLAMDLTAYRTAFLSTFRTICSPIVLFDFLRKRFVAAVNAGKEINSLSQVPNTSRFPSWSLIDASAGANLEPVDWEYVAKVRQGVIAVLRLWAHRYTQDFLDDPNLYASLIAFIQKQVSTQSSNPDDADHPKSVASLREVASLLQGNMLRAHARIATASPPAAGSAIMSENNSQAQDPPETFDFDKATAGELVDYMDSVASAFFEKITEADLMIVAELFERQASDPMGWHALRENQKEEPQIINMYKLLESLNTQTSDNSMVSLNHRLPAAVRDACGAQVLLRAWVTGHIIESRIGLWKRQARIEKLLDAVWICRARMLNARQEEPSTTPLAANAPLQEATVGSYVESVIIVSLTTPESKLFVRAWQEVCNARGASGEGLADLLPRKNSLVALNNAAVAPSTPDLAWLLRCIAQSVSRKTPLVHSDSTLVDFGRSQVTFNLVESSLGLRPTAADSKAAELASLRLGLIQKRIRKTLWNRNLFKEDAAHEAAMAPPLSNRSSYRAYRLFGRLVVDQSEKQQRDRAAYEGLKDAAANEAAARAAATRSPTLGAQEFMGKVSLSSGQAGAVASQEKRSRRVTALFRGAVRQTGLMGNIEKADRIDHVPRSHNELLHAVPTQKPALVVGLGGAQVAAWNNSQRSFVLHLTSQDGTHLLLQAAGPTEMADWTTHLETAIREAPQPPRSADSRRQLAGSGRQRNAALTPLYGCDITTLVEKEGRQVPAGLEKMLAEIEARGLRETGIYRISGAKNSIEALKQAFSTQSPEAIDLQHGEFSDVHTIAGAVKLWFRELPEPAIPFAFYNRMIEAEKIQNHDDRLYAIRDAIWEFPKPHFDLLRRISEHLARVVEEGEHNLMLPHNIGLVFATSLLNPPPSATSVAESFGQLGKAAHIVKLIISFHDWLFEPEPEPEQEQEVAVEQDSQPLGSAGSAATTTGGLTVGIVGSENVSDGTLPVLDVQSDADDLSATDTSSLVSSSAAAETAPDSSNRGSDDLTDPPVDIEVTPDERDTTQITIGDDTLDAMSPSDFAEASESADVSVDADKLLEQLQADAAASAAAQSHASAARSNDQSQLGKPGATGLLSPATAHQRLPSGGARRGLPREQSVYSDALEVAAQFSDNADEPHQHQLSNGASPNASSSSQDQSGSLNLPPGEDPAAGLLDLGARTSLVPDEAMLDILRLMGTQEYSRLEEDGNLSHP